MEHWQVPYMNQTTILLYTMTVLISGLGFSTWISLLLLWFSFILRWQRIRRSCEFFSKYSRLAEEFHFVSYCFNIWMSKELWFAVSTSSRKLVSNHRVFSPRFVWNGSASGNQSVSERKQLFLKTAYSKIYFDRSHTLFFL